MSIYVNPIAIGILVSFLIIYFALIPILIYQYRIYETVRVRRNLVIASFVLYMITAWFMTVLPLPSFETVRSMKPIHPNFRLFLFVKTFLDQSGFILTKPGTWFMAIRTSCFYTVVFNLVLTVPFGVYLRKYFRLSLPWVALLGFLLSAFYEITQYTGLYGLYPKAYRFTDVDDLLVNTLGTVAGYLLTGCIDKLLPNPEKDHMIITDKVSLLRRLLTLFIDFSVIRVLFELGRGLTGRNKNYEIWNLILFLVLSVIVLILLPLLTRYKQTIGMYLLKLEFRNKEEQEAGISRILLHNLLIGIWLYSIYGAKGRLPSLGPEIIIIQLFFIVWLLMIIVKSVSQRSICYYWESWFNLYLKVNSSNKVEKSKQL